MNHSSALGNSGLPECSELESRVSISADSLAWLEAKALHQLRVIRIHPFGAKTYSDIITQPLGVEHFQFAIVSEVARPVRLVLMKRRPELHACSANEDGIKEEVNLAGVKCLSGCSCAG